MEDKGWIYCNVNTYEYQISYASHVQYLSVATVRKPPPPQVFKS